MRCTLLIVGAQVALCAALAYRLPVTAATHAQRSAPACMLGGFGQDTFKYTGNVRPGTRSPTRAVPAGVTRPDYAGDGKPKARGPLLPWQVEVKTKQDIEGMRVAGRVAREVLDAAIALAAPGVTTDAIDARVHKETVKRGAYPSPLNYHGFPKSCCTSVNEVICHGIPDSSVLQVRVYSWRERGRSHTLCVSTSKAVQAMSLLTTRTPPCLRSGRRHRQHRHHLLRRRLPRRLL
jgi:hypothetical protein